MKTYTILAKEINGNHVIPLKRAKATKEDAMKAGWNFSKDAKLCDVMVRCGWKHVATYRNGEMIEYQGKAHTQ